MLKKSVLLVLLLFGAALQAIDKQAPLVWKMADDVMLVMVPCPAGSFVMGSPVGEAHRDEDEVQHRVTLTKQFWISKYEVTQAQYKLVMGNNPSRFRGADRPVDGISWSNAMAFCERLNQLTEGGRRPAGYKFSLPTEAQWEYACRAGTTGTYAGNLNSMGWYFDNSRKQTHSVGQKRPNAWGIYDMHGNVQEWCLDVYGDYHGDAIDPTGPESGYSHVHRGGCWHNGEEYCRCAYRDGSGHYSGNGIRIVLVPDK